MVSTVSVLKEHRFASLNIYSVCISPITAVTCLHVFLYLLENLSQNNLNKPKLNNNTACISPSSFT